MLTGVVGLALCVFSYGAETCLAAWEGGRRISASCCFGASDVESGAHLIGPMFESGGSSVLRGLGEGVGKLAVVEGA